MVFSNGGTINRTDCSIELEITSGPFGSGGLVTGTISGYDLTLTQGLSNNAMLIKDDVATFYRATSDLWTLPGPYCPSSIPSCGGP